MTARDRARSLELIIRAAAAEDRLLQRRLDRAAAEHQRTAAGIASELRRERFGKPPFYPQDGSSDR
jgi:hypothetical protein